MRKNKKLEHFPKSGKRFLDKKCGKNKKLRRRLSDSIKSRFALGEVITALAFILLMMVKATALAQQLPPRLPKLSDYEISRTLEMQEIANFPLTEAFLEKMEKIQAELVDLPIAGDEDATGDDLSVHGLTQAIEARPQVKIILEHYEMKVRDYVLGSMALSNALLAAVIEENEAEENALFFDEPLVISPENRAFGLAFADRIRALRGG